MTTEEKDFYNNKYREGIEQINYMASKNLTYEEFKKYHKHKFSKEFDGSYEDYKLRNQKSFN